MTRLARLRRAILLCAVLVGLPGSLHAQEEAPANAPVVAGVDIVNNQFLQRETLLFYISTKPGDRYDELRVRDDFRRLWDTGFLEDMSLDVVDAPTGKLLRFIVQERRRIQIIDYRGSKVLSNSNIEDELKKREAGLKIDTFYDLGKARRVESILRQMLEEKGRPFGTVKHDAKNVGTAGVQVSFTIDDGPKSYVKEIVFTGNQKFSDKDLRGSMKKLKERRFWNFSWLGGKNTYTSEKWSEDQKLIGDYFLDHGHVTASVGEPTVTYTDGRAGFIKRKPVKWMRIELPVVEGDQYTVGSVKFEGLTVFKEDAIRPLFKLHEGEVYRESRISKGYDKLRDYYGTQGYFQWTALTKRTPDREKKVVDLVLSMEEDKKYYVGRIVFNGNDSTRDKVIRREVYLNEGDVFNTEALKLSIRRINQLGYFKPMEGAPNLQASALGEDKVDIGFKVEEQNRNQFTFGGGVSGLEGTFVNASFQTANFLGLGETLAVSAQSGKRTKNYQLAVTEPYLFDRPITAGFDVYKRKLVYEAYQNVIGYTDARTGFGLVAGFPVGRFSRLFTNYNYEVIDLTFSPAMTTVMNSDGTTTTTNTSTNADGTTTTTVVVTNPDGSIASSNSSTSNTPIFDPVYYGEQGRRKESRFSPALVHNTVDNPYTPRRGIKYTLGVDFTGGPLGGTVNYIKPNLEWISYIPHLKRTSLGVRAQFGYITPYGDTKLLPYYQRYFLGGETQIRGYNIRTVGPIGPGNRLLGGNKFVLFNAEYYFDIIGPLRALLFFDAGQAYLEDQGIDLGQLRTSTGVEMRFIMPVINVPFRLIYALNPNRDAFQPSHTFKFAVGTTF